MITLQFVGAEGLPSDLIKWFSHSPFSHVDAVLPDGRLLGARSDVVGGAPAGVQIRTPNYAKWVTVRRVGLVCPVAMENQFYTFLHSQIGKPYDERAILAFAAGRNWRSMDSWFCSELDTFGLEDCKYFPFPLAEVGSKVDPGDLYFALSATAQLQAA